MSLQKILTGIRTAIKDVANCVSVTAASTNVLTSFCWPVLNGLTVCLRSIMSEIQIRLQLKLWRASLRTSRMHDETKGRILWNLLWSAFRPITPVQDRPEPLRKREELHEYLPDLSAGDRTGFLSLRCNVDGYWKHSLIYTKN